MLRSQFPVGGVGHHYGIESLRNLGLDFLDLPLGLLAGLYVCDQFVPAHEGVDARLQLFLGAAGAVQNRFDFLWGDRLATGKPMGEFLDPTGTLFSAATNQTHNVDHEKAFLLRDNTDAGLGNVPLLVFRCLCDEGTPLCLARDRLGHPCDQRRAGGKQGP